MEGRSLRVHKSLRVHLVNFSRKEHVAYKRSQPRNWCYIYALREASSEQYRYVGQTQVHPLKRLHLHFKHVEAALRTSSNLAPVCRWLADCRKARNTVAIELLDLEGIWNISEGVWIDRLRFLGHPLLNVQSVVTPLEYVLDC